MRPGGCRPVGAAGLKLPSFIRRHRAGLSAGVRRAAFRFPSVQGQQRRAVQPARHGRRVEAHHPLSGGFHQRAADQQRFGQQQRQRSSRPSASGITSPDLTRGAARLNQSATGKGSRKRRRLSAVHGQASRLRTLRKDPQQIIASAGYEAGPPETSCWWT